MVLLDERRGDSAFFMSASLRGDGSLEVVGHDRGPVTESISPSAEYEWSYVVAANDLPALVVSLGGEPGTDVLSWLSERWSGQASWLECGCSVGRPHISRQRNRLMAFTSGPSSITAYLLTYSHINAT